MARPKSNISEEERKARNRAAVRRYREKNREKLLARRRELAARPEVREKARVYAQRRRDIDRDAYNERARGWYRATAEKRIASTLAWRAKNHSQFVAYQRQWRASNKPLIAATAAYKRALKKQRTPPWADLKEIERIYRSRPEGYHVDHIIPLQGETVSGLHVAENLQIIPAEENLRKHNKLLTD